MQADISGVTGTGFSRDTSNLPAILGTLLINCGWAGTLQFRALCSLLQMKNTLMLQSISVFDGEMGVS